MIRTEFLQETIFTTLERATRQHLTSSADLWEFEARDIFYKQGDEPIGLFLIKHGQVKLYRQSQEKAQILALLSHGDTFGADANCGRNPHSTFAEALSNGSAIFLSAIEVGYMIHQCPDFSLLLLHLVSTELQQFTTLVHSLAFRDVTSRLAQVILKQVNLQQKRPQHNQIILERNLSQQDLADLVGTAREVIYRTLKKLQQEQLLRLTSAEIQILDFDHLLELADTD